MTKRNVSAPMKNKPRFRVIFREDRLFHYGDPILRTKPYTDLMDYFRNSISGYMLSSKESGVNGAVAYLFELGNKTIIGRTEKVCDEVRAVFSRGIPTANDPYIIVSKEKRDEPGNLIALCRKCHNDAHGPNSREIRQILKQIVIQRT